MNIAKLSSASRRSNHRPVAKGFDYEEISLQRKHSKRLLHAKLVLKNGEALVSPERFRGERDDYGLEVVKGRNCRILRKGSQSLEWYRNKKQTLAEQVKEEFDPEGKGERLRPDLYNLQALLSRESLKYDPMIVSILESLWKVVDDNQNGKLEYEEYREFHGRLVHIFIPRCTRAQAQKYLQHDWSRDTRGGKGVITKKLFCGSMFELADKWTDEISAPAYIEFLVGTLQAITKLAPGGRRVYKDMNVVKREAKRRKSRTPKLEPGSKLKAQLDKHQRKTKRHSSSSSLGNAAASPSSTVGKNASSHTQPDQTLKNSRSEQIFRPRLSSASAGLQKGGLFAGTVPPTRNNTPNELNPDGGSVMDSWREAHGGSRGDGRRTAVDADTLQARLRSLGNEGVEGLYSYYPGHGIQQIGLERPHTSNGTPSSFAEYYDHVMPSTLYPPPPSWWARYATDKFPVDAQRRYSLERFDTWRRAENKLIQSYSRPCHGKERNEPNRSHSLGQLPGGRASTKKPGKQLERVPAKFGNMRLRRHTTTAAELVIHGQHHFPDVLIDTAQQKLIDYLRQNGHVANVPHKEKALIASG